MYFEIFIIAITTNHKAAIRNGGDLRPRIKRRVLKVQ